MVDLYELEYCYLKPCVVHGRPSDPELHVFRSRSGAITYFSIECEGAESVSRGRLSYVRDGKEYIYTALTTPDSIRGRRLSGYVIRF